MTSLSLNAASTPTAVVILCQAPESRVAQEPLGVPFFVPGWFLQGNFQLFAVAWALSDVASEIFHGQNF